MTMSTVLYNPLNCVSIEELLDYKRGALSEERQTSVRQHLEYCLLCMDALLMAAETHKQEAAQFQDIRARSNQSARRAIQPTPFDGQLVDRARMGIRRKSIDDLRSRIKEMRKQIAHRAFELFEANGCENGHDWEHWFRAESETLAVPRCEILESLTDSIIYIPVHGFDGEDLAIWVDQRRLIITGERRKEAPPLAGVHILRILDIPRDFEWETVKATFDNGVLELKLPKHEKGEVASASA